MKCKNEGDIMDRTQDLTCGKVSSKLLGFFFPMLFTNLLQQIYTVADTAIIGKGLNDYALGAVGNLSSMTLLIIGFSLGMTSGFAVIIAQNYGAGDRDSLRKSIALSGKLSAVMAVVLTMAGCLLLKPLLFALQTNSVLIADGLKYGYIIMGGLSATIAYNLCSGILRSLGDSKTPFTAIVLSSAVNIVLDYIFIFVFHTGVEGAAVATVFAQALSAVICFRQIKSIRGLQFSQDDFRTDWKMDLSLLKNGIPMALMNSITAIGCMVVQRYVNDCGAEYTAAYSVCNKYLNLFMLPSLTAGFAISAFVSQNYGAGKADRIQQGIGVCIGIAFVSYILLGAGMIFLPNLLARLMLNDSETISLTAQYLKICGIGLILLNLLFIYRNAVQGMGHPIIPMLSGIAEMLLRIPMIIILLPRIGFPATAFAEWAAWIGALLLNAVGYRLFLKPLSKHTTHQVL